MRLDVEATCDTLLKMGVSEDDIPFAVEATKRLAWRYGPGRHERAAEFVGSVMATCDVHDVGILLIPNLMYFAERLAT